MNFSSEEKFSRRRKTAIPITTTLDYPHSFSPSPQDDRTSPWPAPRWGRSWPPAPSSPRPAAAGAPAHRPPLRLPGHCLLQERRLNLHETQCATDLTLVRHGTSRGLTMLRWAFVDARRSRLSCKSLGLSSSINSSSLALHGIHILSAGLSRARRWQTIYISRHNDFVSFRGIRMTECCSRTTDFRGGCGI